MDPIKIKCTNKLHGDTPLIRDLNLPEDAIYGDLAKDVPLSVKLFLKGVAGYSSFARDFVEVFVNGVVVPNEHILVDGDHVCLKRNSNTTTESGLPVSLVWFRKTGSRINTLMLIRKDEAITAKDFLEDVAGYSSLKNNQVFANGVEVQPEDHILSDGVLLTVISRWHT